MEIFLYKDYFQKSRVFLYSSLGFKRGGKIVPIDTFTQWEGYFTMDDYKLCLLYKLQKTEEFKNFEDKQLLKHEQFYDVWDLKDGTGVYVYDFSAYPKDWEWFCKSRFSFFSEGHKKKILNYYGKDSPNFPYVESFLYPDKYYRLYSELLCVDECSLRLVKELCTVINKDKETLKVSRVADRFIKY
jgi:hypothetical protein